MKNSHRFVRGKTVANFCASIDYKSSMHTGFFIYLHNIMAVVINALRKSKLANY